MQIDDNTLYNTVLTALGAAWAWATASWRRLTQRVAEIERAHVTRDEHEKLKDVTLTKVDFREYVTRADESRAELRESIVKLFDRVDEVKDIVLELKRDR